VTPYPSTLIIPGLDTVLVGEIEEHALAVPDPINHHTCSPFLIHECGYGNIIG